MTYKIAQTYAQLGDKQSAPRLLRRSIELNFYPYAYFASDPLMEPLRGEPEYSNCPGIGTTAPASLSQTPA
jgi:hypothetical protein